MIKKRWIDLLDSEPIGYALLDKLKIVEVDLTTYDFLRPRFSELLAIVLFLIWLNATLPYPALCLLAKTRLNILFQDVIVVDIEGD